nr:hypothetical protein 1 [Lactuca sativa dicistroviridae]
MLSQTSTVGKLDLSDIDLKLLKLVDDYRPDSPFWQESDAEVESESSEEAELPACFDEYKTFVRSLLRNQGATELEIDGIVGGYFNALEYFFFCGSIDTVEMTQMASTFVSKMNHMKALFDRMRPSIVNYRSIFFEEMLDSFDQFGTWSDPLSFEVTFDRFFSDARVWIERGCDLMSIPSFSTNPWAFPHTNCVADDYDPETGRMEEPIEIFESDELVEFADQQCGVCREKKEEIQRQAAKARIATEKRAIAGPKQAKKVFLDRQKARDAKYITQQSCKLLSPSYQPISIPGTLSRHLDVELEFAFQQTSIMRGVLERMLGDKGGEEGLLESLGRDAKRVLSEANESRPFSKVAQAATDISNVMGELRSWIQSIQDTFRGLFDTVSRHVPRVCAIVISVTLIYWAVKSQTVSDFLITCVGLAIGAIFGSSLWNAIREFFYKGVADQGVQQQAGFFNLNIENFAKLMTTVFVVQSFGSERKWLVDRLTKRVAEAPRVVTGLKELVAWAVEALRTLANAVCHFFGHPGFKCFERTESNVERILREVQDLYEEHLADPTKDPQARFGRMSNCLRELFEIKRLYHGVKDIEMRLTEAQRMIAAVQAPIRQAAAMNAGFRPEPVAFCLQGEPGVGKTLMFQNLVVNILLVAGLIKPGTSSEEAAKHIFQKPWNSPYWEGYFNQMVVALDDFGLSKPVAGQDTNCYLDLATIIGPIKTMVNTAACENKGMYSMNCRIVAATTNVKDMNAEASAALTEPMAVIRRFSFPYQVTVKPEFCMKGTKKLDYRLFSQELQACSESDSLFGRYPWHIWEFREFCFQTGQAKGGVISVPEFICRVAERVKDNETAHHVNVSVMDKLLSCEPPNPKDYLQSLRSETAAQQSGSSSASGPSSPSGAYLEKLFEGAPHSQLNKMMLDVAGLRLGMEPVEHLAMIPEFGTTTFCPCCDRTSHMSACCIRFGCLGEEYDKAYEPSYYTDSSRRVIELGPIDECIGHPSCYKATDLYPITKEEAMEIYTKTYPVGKGNRMFQMCIERFKETTASYKTHSKAWTVVKTAALVGALTAFTAGAIMLVVKCFKAAWNYIKELIWPVEQADEQSNRSIKPKSVTFEHLRPRGVQQQAGRSPDLAGNVYDNSYKVIVCTTDGGFMVLGQIVFLRGGTFVMPNHFLTSAQKLIDEDIALPGSKIKIRGCMHEAQDIAGGLTLLEFLQLPYHVLESEDLAFGVLTGVCAKADVVKFLIKEEELKDVSNKAVRLDTARVDQADKLVPWNKRLSFLDPHVNYGTHTLQCGSNRHKRWFRYAALTEVGDCGAPLCLQRAVSFQHRVWLGLHIGGREGWGYSTVLTQEMANDALDKLVQHDAHLKQYMIKQATAEETDQQCGMYSKCEVTFQNQTQFPFADEPLDSFGSFTAMCTVSKPVSVPARTKLVKTLAGVEQIFGPSDSVPMRMGPYRKDGETVYPMVDALTPYASEVIRVDGWWVRPGIWAAMRMFSEATRHVQGRVLTYEEAVVGNPSMGLKGIPRNTSAGYPDCLIAEDKTFYWGSAEKYDLKTPNALRLQKEVEQLEEMLLRGERPFFVCRGFLKDETRKQGKGARYIAGTPVQYYILCRKYFGAMVAAQLTTYKETGLCPGIREYMDWPWLRGWLTRPGGKCWDGDFKGFDSSQMPTFSAQIGEYINEWYSHRGGTAEENMVRTILLQDLLYSRHLVGRGTNMNTIVQLGKSLPSGHFLTAAFNSEYAMAALVCCYLILTYRLDYWEQCACCTLGDDNGNGASDEVAGDYNQVTLAQCLGDHFGLTYTSAKKDGTLQPYTSIEECEFLKRGFHIVDGKETCPLAEGSMLHSMYWVRESRCASKEQILADSCENALGELSLHGAEKWKEWSPAIIQLMATLGKTPMLPAERHNDYLAYMLTREDSSWSGLQRRLFIGLNDGSAYQDE